MNGTPNPCVTKLTQEFQFSVYPVSRTRIGSRAACTQNTNRDGIAKEAIKTLLFWISGEASLTKRILVVEDQQDNRQIVRDLLVANDYELSEAENGEEALLLAAKDRPDLILMDIQLPIMDGYEATRRIKADPYLRSIPVIAVTSYALNGDEEKARAAGCNDFVPKPFSPRQLLAKIRQYLS
jgi:two-component system cell cycle response regulator DivK